jgi:hypothetical protein
MFIKVKTVTVSCCKNNQPHRVVQPLAGKSAEQTGENGDFAGEPASGEQFRFLQCSLRQYLYICIDDIQRNSSRRKTSAVYQMLLLLRI